MKFAFTLPIFLATYVSAHGELFRVTIDGKTFSKSDPQSIIRVVSSQDPNKGAFNPAITCGPDAKSAALSASVNPGTSMSVDWRTASDGTVSQKYLHTALISDSSISLVAPQHRPTSDLYG